MTSYENKAVLVTGASSGIGEATACHLDHLGFTVYAGVRTEQAAEQLEKKSSERLIPVFLDITDPESVRAAVSDLARDLKATGLYGLVNNAGIVVAGPLEHTPIGALKRQFNVNVFSQIAVTQAFLPLIRQSAQTACPGRIINMSSIAGRSVFPFIAPYSASKFALEAFSDALRMELKPWAIHVAVIEPGATRTPLWEKSEADALRMFRQMPDTAQQRYERLMIRIQEQSRRSAQRGIDPFQVAKAVAHALTSFRPKTRYVVGTDAKCRLFLSCLPDGVKDRLIAYVLRLRTN